MASLTQGFEQRQQQWLSPRLQRAVRLLQLSSLDFAQEVNSMLDKNPFLESEDDAALAAPGAAAADTAPFTGEAKKEALPTHETEVIEVPADDPSRMEQSADAESWHHDGASTHRRNDDDGFNFLDMHAIEDSLADHLQRQIKVLSLNGRDTTLAEAIINCLDDDGYLRFALSELTGVTGLNPAPSEEELQIALSHVQALDPAGVGARSVQECLLLQLTAITDGETRSLARSIIEQHLPMLAARDIPGLARVLEQSPARVDEVLDCIRRLDPRPGWRFGSSQVQYVIPDVVVKKIRGGWNTSLNPSIVPRVRLNHVYAEMFQRNRNAQHAELAAHLAEARWTVTNVEQRFATILSVAQAIVKHQRLFLEYGPLAMKPLGLKEIADEVGVHESTVSRVTNNKFMATPLGVFELKYFFSRPMTTASGGECSATAIRRLIRDMIEAENAADPLSDAEIGRLLARQGILVARRTVTKYRQQLHIEAFERRRKHS